MRWQVGISVRAKQKCNTSSKTARLASTARGAKVFRASHMASAAVKLCFFWHKIQYKRALVIWGFILHQKTIHSEDLKTRGTDLSEAA